MNEQLQMDVTNRFVLDYATRFAESCPDARILDYGCGAGRLVNVGRSTGLQVVGADVFYAGSNTRVEVEQAGLLNLSIFEIQSGRLPFPDESFHLVVNNQVMEHVDDLDSVLSEIHRVLKPGGRVLSLFPSRDVLREGHIGIPLSHRFPKNSRIRFYYTWLLRRLGLGTWKEQAPTCRQWAIDKLQWIDTYTVYRTRREIFGSYNRGFTNRLIEIEYIRYRLLQRPGRAWIVSMLRLPFAAPLAEAVFRKLAFLVIESQKQNAARESKRA